MSWSFQNTRTEEQRFEETGLENYLATEACQIQEAKHMTVSKAVGFSHQHMVTLSYLQ